MPKLLVYASNPKNVLNSVAAPLLGWSNPTTLLTSRKSFRFCSMFLFWTVNMAAATWLMAVARQWMLFL